MNNLNKLTVVIVTYKTDPTILRNCINSIDNNVEIKIVENSSKMENQPLLINKKDNLSIYYTGKNLGYGAGNNYGFNLVNTDYVIVANPDIIFHKTFFDNVKKYLVSNLNFTIIGSTYNEETSFSSSGLFKENEKKKYQNDLDFYLKKSFDTLTKVDWVTGCMMLINLKKFDNRKLFDESFFLYFEEFDLCKSTINKGGSIYSSSDLRVHHLGFKGSLGANNKLKNDANKLRDWHWMWSYFYFYKKNYNYIYALWKVSGKFFKSLLKSIYYALLFNKLNRDKYLYRFLGLLFSIIGIKSNYRGRQFY